MSEFRQNFITKEWVVIATDRAKRPDAFRHEREEKLSPPEFKADCPFCPGNESHTTDETYRKSDGEKWSVRLFLNKFAILDTDQLTDREYEGAVKVVRSKCQSHKIAIDIITTISALQTKYIIDEYSKRWKI